ncbi:VanW family protein [Nocardia grenadensis]|uniref:VanW family protein n=1 Tax=Nocardia grenadensis TaxID=931537 RepID=UPI0007A478FB|nr:VanW family protein [Nocardia grenadensis]
MSSESSTDRGDRRDHGRPQPVDGGLRQLLDSGRAQQGQQSPAPTEPVEQAGNVASGWRGGSSWLNPSAGSAAQRSAADQDPSSAGSVSGAASPHTLPHAADAPRPAGRAGPPGPGAPGPSGPGPSGARPANGPGPAGPPDARPANGSGPVVPSDARTPRGSGGPAASGPGPSPAPGAPSGPGGVPGPARRPDNGPSAPSGPAPADPTGPEYTTQQFSLPTAAPPPAAFADADPDDAPTEVFDSGALNKRLSGGPSSWPGHPNNPTSADILAHGDKSGPPTPPRGPGGGRGTGGSGDDNGRFSAARTWLRDSANARRVLLVAAIVFGVALVGYIADLVLTSGKIPRGVEVADIAIGGMDKDDARAKLQATLDPRSGEVVPVKIGDVQTELVPAAAGLGVDWEATWERVGGQPLNPASRLLSFVATREVTVASSVDETAMSRTFDELKVHDQPPVEGGIHFEGTRPIEVNPVSGRVLDVAAARTVITEQWATASTLDLPVAVAPPAVRQDAIDAAMHQIAEPAVSAPVSYTGKEGATAALSPEQIATIIGFVPDGHGGLRVEFDHKVATDLLAPQLADTEVEPEDATFTFSGAPTVEPAVVGDKVNWAKTLDQLPAMLAATGAPRTTPAIYERIEPKLTTQAAEALGINETMGEFTTSGFTGPSGVNIRTVAQEVDGAVVKPGDTFSLNTHTGPRTAAEGYVESGIIDHGRPSKAVGGGISQFATTLYNAAYFAGLEDAGHTEHSYYISRYPAAREATVFDGAIDLQFRNNTPHGIYIQAVADSSQVTVRIWGTKTVNVESFTGDRTKPTEPETITLPEGDDCIASTGAPGFTTSDTRVITDINTGAEISRHTRTVKYDPVPEVKCESPDKEKAEESTDEPSGGSQPGSTAPSSRPSSRPGSR